MAIGDSSFSEANNSRNSRNGTAYGIRHSNGIVTGDGSVSGLACSCQSGMCRFRTTNRSLWYPKEQTGYNGQILLDQCPLIVNLNGHFVNVVDDKQNDENGNGRRWHGNGHY